MVKRVGVKLGLMLSLISFFFIDFKGFGVRVGFRIIKVDVVGFFV